MPANGPAQQANDAAVQHFTEGRTEEAPANFDEDLATSFAGLIRLRLALSTGGVAGQTRVEARPTNVRLIMRLQG